MALQSSVAFDMHVKKQVFEVAPRHYPYADIVNNVVPYRNPRGGNL